MFAHMAWCYTQLRDYAADTAHPLTLTWIVRSRFDNVFFAPVPALQGLATDAVHSRARRIGHGWHNVDNEMISYLPLRQTFLLILSSFRIGMPECGCPVTFPHVDPQAYFVAQVLDVGGCLRRPGRAVPLRVPRPAVAGGRLRQVHVSAAMVCLVCESCRDPDGRPLL